MAREDPSKLESGAPRAADGPSFFRRREQEKLEPAPGLTADKQVGDFRLIALIGQGGMGQVWEAEQLSLKRRVAVKFVRPERVTPHQLELFAREARAGGRLSHPGLVGVHGHGQSDGLAWIALEFVGGAWTLRDFLDEAARLEDVPEGHDRHVARFVAEIAEAMQVAHEAGVIHRDLKPQNILITAEDRPKVTDFGLARITDEAALSVTGEFAGTYLYMSPEQAMAKRIGIDHRTDVFSLGIVLYELLALRRPFEGDTGHQIAAQILYRDPPDLRTIRSKIPRDLMVITGKALEKEREKRFPTMREFAADLRRFMADEPIHARPPTRMDRMVKWMKRHPGKTSAAGIVSVAVVVIAALLLANVRANRDLTRANVDLAAANAALGTKTAESEERRKEAEAKRDEVLKLAALQDLEDLLAQADGLWPAHTENIGRYEDWIRAARALVAGLPGYRARRDELRAKALPQSAEKRAAERASHPKAAQLAVVESELVRVAGLMDAAPTERAVLEAEETLLRLEQERGALEPEVKERRDWTFPPEEPETRWWNNQLTKLIEGLVATDEGLLAEGAITVDHGWSIPKRLAFARSLAASFGEGGEHALRWAEALPAIRAAYPGLTLVPQVGLAPIGPDPRSGLWEFAHLQSGAIPVRGQDGELILQDETGLVFVLLPGGTFQMGAQNADPEGQNYDPMAVLDEGPVHTVSLSPLFLSKYEVTQGQWERLVGRNPSYYGPNTYDTAYGSNEGKKGRRGWTGWTALHPVEAVSWTASALLMDRLGLRLPTEAQWEYACRAGTTSAYSSGGDAASLQGVANLSDAYGRANGNESYPVWEPWLDDGHSVHAEVGLYEANALGFHDMHGNVWEWCLDGYQPLFYGASPAQDPLAPPPRSSTRVLRGGSFYDLAKDARSAHRNASTIELGDFNIGLRPAKAIQP